MTRGVAVQGRRGGSGHRRLSAGIIPVRFVEDGPRFLLLRAFRYWDFPKGEVEEGEDPLEAARRELREETGIGEIELTWGADFVETPPYAGGKIARYYLAQTRTPEVTLPVSPELGRPEHHEYRWATADEAHALLGPRLRPVLEWAEARIRGPRPPGGQPGSGSGSARSRCTGGAGPGASRG